MQKALVRYATNNAGSYDRAKAEADLGKQLISAGHEGVSTESSIHPVTGEVGLHQEEQEVDMMAGIRSDFVGLFFINEMLSQTNHGL